MTGFTNGPSNVMEQHGVKFTDHTDRLRRSMEKCNIAYLHAPLFNPALKALAPIRKALAVRTFFNMLGPLVNPVIPTYQLLVSTCRHFKFIGQRDFIISVQAMYYRKAGSAFLIGIGIQAEQREVVYSEQLIGGDDRVYQRAQHIEERAYGMWKRENLHSGEPGIQPLSGIRTRRWKYLGRCHKNI